MNALAFDGEGERIYLYSPMKIESNPQRLLLKLAPGTHARLGLARLPFGYTRTKWINEAICEKLDRDQPETRINPGESAPVAPVESPPLVNVATPASEPEDFWGEDDGYAKIKKKAQSRI